MLNKPLSHLRPLLRIPTHHTPQPDLFTANPSLLHHLPSANNAHGHAIAQTGGNAASSGSGAGSSGAGAGRAGWAGSGPGQGGYTGHARAFLSLSQTGAVDPSSSLNNSDEQRQQTASARQSAVLKNRLGRTIKVVDIDEPVAGPSSQIPLRLTNRGEHGSRKLKAVDLGHGDERTDGRPEMRTVESGPSRRRSSIVFPSSSEVEFQGSSPLPRARPSGSSPRPRTLGRSTSSADLWQVGIPSRPAQLSVRPLSTRTSTIDLPQINDIDESTHDITAVPPLSAHRIPQPNRVLQDLAGLDLPLMPRGVVNQVRHNSTSAASSRSRTTDDILVTSWAGGAESGANAASDKQKHSNIFKVLDGAIAHSRKTQARQLIEHYRRPRATSPFGPPLPIELQQLEDRLPLPTGYQTDLYNLCLEGVLAFRSTGNSIATVLEIYNEMIERDVVLNWKTYALVIRALSLRETDIARAARNWAEDEEYVQWRQKHYGTPVSTSLHQARDETLRGYRAEANLASAMKLFQTAILLNEHEWKFSSATYDDLLAGAVAAAESATDPSEINLRAAMDVFRHGMSRNVSGMRGMYRHIFKLHALAGDHAGLAKAWNEFSSIDKGHGAVPSEWIVRELATRTAEDALAGAAADEKDRSASMVHAVEAVWAAAVEAFVRVGDVPQAEQIMQAMLDSRNYDARISSVEQDLHHAPRPTPEIFARLVLALEETGHSEAAQQWWSKMTANPVLAEVYASGVYDLPTDLAARLVCRFVVNDRADLAFQVLACPLWSARLRARIPALAVRHAYGALVILGLEAASAGRLEEAQQIATAKLPAVFGMLPSSSSQLPAESQTLMGNCKLLVQVGRADLAGDAIARFSFNTFKASFARELGQLLAPEIEQLNLDDALAVVAEFRQKNTDSSGGPLAGALLRLFERVRGTTESGASVVASQQHWCDLLECASSLEKHDLKDGAYDDVLSRLMDDVSREDVYKPNGTRFAWSSDLIGNLEERFGSERTAQFKIALRMEPDGTPSALPAQEHSPESVQEADSASVSSLESPTQPSTPPPPPQVGAMEGYFIDAQLSTDIDKLVAPQVTNHNKCGLAYQAFKTGLQQGRLLHPRALGRLIAALGRDGQEARLRQVYDHAQTTLSVAPETQQPDFWRSIEDSMIMGMCALGHLEAAGMHRSRLLEAGMTPSADAYGTMIASSKDTTDDAMVALSLFEEAVQHGIRPHLYLYNTVISKLSKARKAEAALTLFAQLKADGIKPTSVTYGALINGCCRVGDAESAETLFAEMTQMRNFKPRVPPYNTMMQFYLQTTPDRERVLHYYQLLLQSGVQPSAHTYKLLLDAYTVIEPVDIASMERVFQSLQADPNVQVQGTHYASVVTAFGKHVDDVDGAIAFFNSIPPRQLESVVWEALLNVLAQTGTLAQLEEYHGRLFSSSIAPTAYVYNALISGYARLGQIERARDIFESMGDSIVGVAAPNNHPALLTNSGHQKPSTMTSGPTGMVYREPSTYTRMIVAELEHGGSRDRAEAVLARMEARAYPYAVFAKTRALVYGPDMPTALDSQIPTTPAEPRYNSNVNENAQQSESSAST